MNNLSLLTVIEKNKLHSDQPFLFALQIEVWDEATQSFIDTLRFVQNDEDVTIDGEAYQALPFEIQIDKRSDSTPSVNISIQDQLQMVQSYLQTYKGGTGSNVKVLVVTGPDKDALTSEVELSDDFAITNSSVKDYVVTWELGVDNPLNQNVPARVALKNVCSFIYKSQNCGYSGAMPTCDLSLAGANGCRAHDNEGNYGGMPGIIVRG
jgi:phage-related protein